MSDTCVYKGSKLNVAQIFQGFLYHTIAFLCCFGGGKGDCEPKGSLTLLKDTSIKNLKRVVRAVPLLAGNKRLGAASEPCSSYHRPENLHQHHVVVDGDSSVNQSFAAQSISQSRARFLQYKDYATAPGKFS